jgi:glycerate kinase
MQLRKVIIAPDSFKGTLTSGEVADAIAAEVGAAFPGCNIIKMPIADGGEGSVDTILAAIGGDVHEAIVLSPDDRQIAATFGTTGSGMAILEMAQSSGITLGSGS